MHNIDELKQSICDIGDRMYRRGFMSANEGNISIRLNEREVLCTPTMHCKGFHAPDDICLIDMDGCQLAGEKRRSSESLLHLEILKSRPDVGSVVHCHPPHASAFAVARETIPQAVMPEAELFLGEVPITKYETPVRKKFAESVLPFVHQSNVIVLANHGTVSYGETVERAYWLTAILDSYWRILIHTRQLGPVHYMSPDQLQELLADKKVWGLLHPRHDPDFRGDIREKALFRYTWHESEVEPRAFRPRSFSSPTQ